MKFLYNYIFLHIGNFINKHWYEYKTITKFTNDIRKYQLLMKKLPINTYIETAFNYSNGCGSKGGFMFPSFFLWVCVISACTIHDIEWKFAISYEDLEEANRRFRRNLQLICDYHAGDSKILQYVFDRFIGYYVAGVRISGTSAYAKEREFIKGF